MGCKCKVGNERSFVVAAGLVCALKRASEEEVHGMHVAKEAYGACAERQREIAVVS